VKGGFKGECWQCGEHGHSARFCPRSAGKRYGKDVSKGTYKGDYGKGYGKDSYKGKGYQNYGKGGKGSWSGVYGMWEEPAWDGGPVQLFGIEESMKFQAPKHTVKKAVVAPPPGLSTHMQNRLAALDVEWEEEDPKEMTDQEVEELMNEWVYGVKDTDQVEKSAGKKSKVKAKKDEDFIDEDGLPVMALFSPEPEVNHVRRAPQWVKLEAVVDSGAAESVAPESMAPWIPMKESEGSKRGQTYLSASGDKLPNLGEKKFDMMTVEGHWAQATFQVAEVTRPLCSVSKMCDKGNRVVFEMGGGYVENLTTGVRTSFSRENNVYVMEMHVQEDSAVSAIFGRQA